MYFTAVGKRSPSIPNHRVAGCWLLVAGYWLLVAGYWLLVSGVSAAYNMIVAEVRANLGYFIDGWENQLMSV